MICNDAIELNEYFNDGEVSNLFKFLRSLAKEKAC